jgi:hypothetical protein
MSSLDSRLTQTIKVVKYWQFEEPSAPLLHGQFKEHGEVHKNFLILRDKEHLLFIIRTKEDEEPPTSLRGSFTTLKRAKDHIDSFFDREEKAAIEKETNKK